MGSPLIPLLLRPCLSSIAGFGRKHQGQPRAIQIDAVVARCGRVRTSLEHEPFAIRRPARREGRNRTERNASAPVHIHHSQLPRQIDERHLVAIGRTGRPKTSAARTPGVRQRDAQRDPRVARARFRARRRGRQCRRALSCSCRRVASGGPIAPRARRGGRPARIRARRRREKQESHQWHRDRPLPARGALTDSSHWARVFLESRHGIQPHALGSLRDQRIDHRLQVAGLLPHCQLTIR